MLNEIKMPFLGIDVQIGTIAQWYKKIGDYVQKGELLAEIECDKVTLELEAELEGVLVEVLLQQGESAKEGEVIAFLKA